MAGLLWSTVSPLAAFVFLAAAMIIGAALIITAQARLRGAGRWHAP